MREKSVLISLILNDAEVYFPILGEITQIPVYLKTIVEDHRICGEVTLSARLNYCHDNDRQSRIDLIIEKASYRASIQSNQMMVYDCLHRMGIASCAKFQMKIYPWILSPTVATQRPLTEYDPHGVFCISHEGESTMKEIRDTIKRYSKPSRYKLIQLLKSSESWNYSSDETSDIALSIMEAREASLRASNQTWSDVDILEIPRWITRTKQTKIMNIHEKSEEEEV